MAMATMTSFPDIRYQVSPEPDCGRRKMAIVDDAAKGKPRLRYVYRPGLPTARLMIRPQSNGSR
jgi:hypothetical protein